MVSLQLIFKCHNQFVCFSGSDIRVMKFKGEPSVVQSGNIVEIRGIVNKDHSVSFGECTQYDSEFDLNTYE